MTDSALLEMPIVPLKNHNVLWMCATAVAIVFMILLAFYWPESKVQQPTGFLEVDGGFINVAEPLFGGVCVLRRLRLQNRGVNVWAKVYQQPPSKRDRSRSSREHFILTTQVDGVVYSIKEGQPGLLGLPWGTAFVAPLNVSLPNLVFEDSKNGIMATSNFWSTEDNLHLLTTDSTLALLWNASHHVGKVRFTQTAETNHTNHTTHTNHTNHTKPKPPK